MKNSLLFLFLLCLSCSSPNNNPSTNEQATKDEKENWQPLFNGKNLEGWTPKINGYQLGENYKNTFRVTGDAIQVNYDQYEDFGEKYGHLFYKTPYSNYHLKLQYRFIGEQAPGGEGWAFKNSGVMFHCQAPESMGVDQSFPVSLEAQFLGGNGTDERPTGNLCTPGLHVTFHDSLVTQHCISANAPTFHNEEWVNFELIVHNDSLIQHLVNGKVVIEYSKPVIGGNYLPTPYHLTEGSAIKAGYISLQSESHPIEFRNIVVKEFD